MKRLLLLPVLTTALAYTACGDTASTPTQSEGLTPLFDHKGEPHGKPGGGEDPPDPTGTVEINTVMGGAGIYSDGLGSYPATFNGSGDLWLGADCDREIRLDLTSEGLTSPFNDIIGTCAGGKGKSSASPRITVQTLLGAGAGDILGVEPAHDGTNYSDVTNYYFVIDRTGYNVVYWNGIKVTNVEHDNCPDGTTTYTLSTDPGLAGTGPGTVELRRRDKKGPVLIAPVVAHLDMTVTVTPCQ
jgi:hypothetical protein